MQSLLTISSQICVVSHAGQHQQTNLLIHGVVFGQQYPEWMTMVSMFRISNLCSGVCPDRP
jgi:hypothetical protein